MNRKHTIGAWACALVMGLAAACQHEEVDTYDTSRAGLNIWVGEPTGTVYDAVSYNYSYAYEEESVTFYAQISGVPVGYDRTFALEPYGEQCELVAPTIRSEVYTLPAGAVSGTYKVHFNSQLLPSPDLFTEEDGSISFRVAPGSEFQLGAENRQTFTVTLRNRLAKPDNWDAANYPQVPLSKYFGLYSRVKYQFMIETLGLIDFKISYFASTAIDEATNTVSPAYAVYLQQLVQEKLDAYNAAHETPLTDERGERVTFDS